MATNRADFVNRALALLEAPQDAFEERTVPPAPPPSAGPVAQGVFDEDGQDDDEQEEEAGERPLGDGPGVAIAADFMFPFDVVTQSIGIVAARGAGKTYLTAVMAEEFLMAGLPFVVIDPMGVYWGLRSGADGESEGLDIYILGGEHGDLPLDPGCGKAVARWLTDYRRPAVLDLSDMRKAEQRQFVGDFAEELYAVNKLPLHIIVDEADLFIPQRASPDEKRVLAAFEDIVRRGRVRGLGISVVTQRPAVIHKDILTQIGTLIVLRMLGPQDRKSIEEWIKFHGDPYKQRIVLSSLASLPVGTAWVWSPGWLGVLKRISIRQKITFDSSCAPKADEPPPLPPAYKNELDIDELRAALIDAISYDPNDPAVMKARIAELETALSEGGGENSVVGKLQRRVAELEKKLLRAAPKIKTFDPALLTEHVERLAGAIERIEERLPDEEAASAPKKKAKRKAR
jgi:hypothetical protein